MRSRYAPILYLLLPAAALAQTAGSVVFNESSDTNNGGVSDGVINIAECLGTPSLDTISPNWLLSAAPAADTTFEIWATPQACPTKDVTPTNFVKLTSSPQPTNGAQSGSWSTLSGSGIDVRGSIILPLAVDCGASTNINICVAVSSGNTVADQTARATLKVDASKPAAPSGVTVTVGDGALNVSWSVGSGGSAAPTSYTATASPVGAGAGTCSAATASGPTQESCTVNGSGSTSCRIDGLTNNACYAVTVQAISAIKNPSANSQPAYGMPAPVDDFWRHYLNAGGREEGGCGSGGAGLFALLAALPLLPRLRRRNP